MTKIVGKITYFKVKSGKVKPGDKLMTGRTGELENLGQLYIITGKQREAVDELVAGDIGAVIKLKSPKPVILYMIPSIKLLLNLSNFQLHEFVRQ